MPKKPNPTNKRNPGQNYGISTLEYIFFGISYI